MNIKHRVAELVFTSDRMRMTVDGQRYSCSLVEISGRLAKASAVERQQYEVSPTGYGIHWPLIDEDLSIDGLLKVARAESPAFPRQKPPRRPMAVAEMRASYGAKGGKATRKAK